MTKVKKQTELRIESYPELPEGDAFINNFQRCALLLLKSRGHISETQYRNGLRILEEKNG